MKKKSLDDLSSLKLIFSTNPDALKQDDEPTETYKNIPFEKQHLRINLDKKHRAGKEVTLIQGFDLNDSELENMAKQLKSKCGIGGGVTEDGLILLQGDQRKKLPDVLGKLGFKKIKVIQ